MRLHVANSSDLLPFTPRKKNDATTLRDDPADTYRGDQDLASRIGLLMKTRSYRYQ